MSTETPPKPDPLANFARLTLEEARDEFERIFIARVLREERGKKAATARRLGITRQSLYPKLKKHGLA